jgi:tetratricopeptide (TPR) repeat protein
MKIRTELFLIVVLLLLGACTSMRRTADATAADPVEFTLLPPAEGSSPAQLATHYYLQGIRAAAIYGNRLQATTCFNTALEYNPEHAPSLYELAALLFPGEVEKALEYSREANRLDPGNIWFKQQLGQILITAEQYDEARRVYDDMVRLDPHNPDNYRYLAALYEETGFPHAALILLDSAEVRFGFIEELSNYKRHLLIATAMTDRAIEEAVTLTLNSPYDSRNFVILGNLYAGTDQDSLAVEAFDRALALDPENIEALMALSDFYLAQNDGARFLATTKRLFALDALPLDKKISFFKDVIETPKFYQEHYFAVGDLAGTLLMRYPGIFEVIELYAQHQIHTGNLDGALKTYKSALSDSAGIQHYRTIIEIESYLEHGDSASRYTDLALEHYPGELDLYFSKGYGQYHMKAYNEAIETLTEAFPYAPDDSMRSVIHASVGEISRARDSLGNDFIRHLRRALKYDPENLHALFQYSDALVDRDKNPEKVLKGLQNDSLRSLMLGSIGDMYYARDSVGNAPKAYAFYEKALRYNPDNVHVLNNYAYFLSLEERDLERALAMSARVQELEPGNPTFVDTHGWILYKLGRYEEAKTALRQAVAFDAGASTELLIHYGDILYELKEYFMASIYWKKALEKGYDPAAIESRLKKTQGK